jgi:signal transduction histidine kinase
MSTPSDVSGPNRPPEGQEHLTPEEQLQAYQRQLRRLASELTLTEARQRRIIAGELHDHIGQTLAFIRMRLTRLRGDAVFSGFEDSIAGILRLVDQAINSARSLTFQISPPVLYELGLGAALEWLGEQLSAEHGVEVRVNAERAIDRLAGDTRVLLFQAIRELLVNAIKHAAPREVVVTANVEGDEAVVVVSDDGCGFDVARAETFAADAMTFGLFSIRERLEYLGGSIAVDSRPGSGTSVTLRTPVPEPSVQEAP